MLSYLKDGSAQTNVHTATLRWKLQIKISISPTWPTSPSADPLTPGAWQNSHWSVKIVESLVWLDPEKSQSKRELKPGPAAVKVEALTTRPTRRRHLPARQHGSRWFIKKIQTNGISYQKNDGCCCWMLNVPATCKCISGTGLLRQFHVLPHWDRSCRPNFPSHPVTVYWPRANQSQHWPYNTRRLAG